MHIRSTIEQLGYTPREVRVYLAALELGDSTLAMLASKTQLPRATVGFITVNLVQKGLLDSYLKQRRKIWVAVNPNKLLIRHREREAALATIMPELLSLQRRQSMKPVVRIYTGAKEVKNIMNDILDTKQHISALHTWNDWVPVFGRPFMDDFIERRVNLKLPIRLLSKKTDLTLRLQTKDSYEFRKTRFLPEGFTINNSIFIYGHKVALITLHGQQSVGVVIEEKNINRTMETFFDCLWQTSSSLANER